MALGRRIGKILLTLISVFGALLFVIGLLLFSQVIEDSDDFANYSVAILTINILGVAVMVALIGDRLVRLVRDYRRFVPGSRLQARVVSLIVIVAAVPLIVIYMFSIAFIARGFDEWFRGDIGEGLDEAVELSRSALDLRVNDSEHQLELIEDRLEAVGGQDRNDELARLGQQIGVIELTLYSADGRVLATYPHSPGGAMPQPLDPALEQELPVVGIELSSDGGGTDEVVGTIAADIGAGEPGFLRGRFEIPPGISALTGSVEARQSQFGRLSLVRTDLKRVTALTLSLVLLVAILAAVYTALFASQRLIRPIQQLMQGTRAVARGDFDTKVPLAQRDEIGFLVNSFNNMTHTLALARQETRDSEQRLEDERHKLEVILARLSTGVVSLESDLRIRTANKAAGEILGLDLEEHIGDSLVDLATTRPLLREFLDSTAKHLEHGRTEWREQISLRGDRGNRELVCACSELPREGEHGEGYILVFDDITALIQAQKDAAWGEVARRLAHEIKNPLTPIQLSAERVRRRYLTDGSRDTDLLDRATHTIIQQVDAMKGMVDAFSEYARAPDIELGELDLNALIGEVTELYRHQVPPVEIAMDLDGSIPLIEADIGRLRQVMHNLMRNASEAVEDQADARIEVSTRLKERSDGPYAEVVVGDNGPGFAPDIIDQAFLPYVTSKTKGTGLGLAIVRKLIEEHGGEIRATNRTVRGAEVSILLPLHGSGRGAGGRVQHRRKRA
jgi:two-component system, NtrC family, nitrogen regulation sensor histidine kinase NtrY